MRRRSRPLIENHVQPRPARDQNIPGSPPSYMRIEIFSQGGEPGLRLLFTTIRTFVSNDSNLCIAQGFLGSSQIVQGVVWLVQEMLSSVMGIAIQCW